MAQGGHDSGIATGDSIQGTYGSLIEQVKNTVIQLYNKNKDDGEGKRVTLWAAEKVKEVATHAANVTAVKIIEQLEEEERSKESMTQRQHRMMFQAFLALALGSAEDKEGSTTKGVSDHSTDVIKYPWKKEEELGRGAFGVVFRAKGQDGFLFAVKEVESHGEEAQSLRTEIECLTKLSHDNIVKCFGCAEGNGKIYMYLELARGSIADRMKKASKACTEAEAKKITIDMVRGLKYLHEKGIIHRDIKCANVLLDATGTAKLGDMGLSKEHAQQTVANYSATGGTIFWMSPEALTQNLVGKRSDIWSLGCTVYEMMKREPPLAGLGIMGLVLLQGGCSQHQRAIEKDPMFQGSLKKFLLQIFVPFEKRHYIEKVAKYKWIS